MWTAREILSMFSRCPHPGHLTATVPQTPRTSGPGGGCVMPIGQTPGGRAPGNRCARPGIAAGPTRMPAPGLIRELRPLPTALPHPRTRRRRVHTATGAGKPGTGSWPRRRESSSNDRDLACKRRAGPHTGAVTVMSTFLQKALQVVASAAKAYRINHSDATVSSSACLAVLRLRFGELRV